MEKKNDEDSESVKAEKTAGDGETKQSNRVKHNHIAHCAAMSSSQKHPCPSGPFLAPKKRKRPTDYETPPMKDKLLREGWVGFCEAWFILAPTKMFSFPNMCLLGAVMFRIMSEHMTCLCVF